MFSNISIYSSFVIEMRVLVPVKRVVDFAVRVRIGADKKAVDLNGVKMAVNPFCEIALEEASKCLLSDFL